MNPNGNKKGRPSTYDPETAGRFCELVADGASDRMAAAELGISTSAVQSWAAAHGDFAGSLTRAREERPAALEGVALDAVAEMAALARSHESTAVQVQAVKYKFDMCARLMTFYSREAEKQREREQAQASTRSAAALLPAMDPETMKAAIAASQASFARIAQQLEAGEAD